MNPSRWRSFCTEHWRKKSYVGRLDRPLFTDVDVMRMLRRAAERVRKGHFQSSVRVYRNDAQLGSDMLPYLPTPADVDLNSYCRRMEQAMQPDHWGLILNQVQTIDPAIQLACAGFLRGFIEEIGLPSGEVEAVAFLGNYKASPFGFHVDGASTFMFPVAGSKRMHLLAREEVPDEFRGRTFIPLEELAERAQTVAAQPGEVLFWPSSYYHVGEIDDWAVSVNLSIWTASEQTSALLLRRVENNLRKLWGERFQDHDPVPSLTDPTRAIELPTTVGEAIEVIGQLDLDGIRSGVEKDWMRRASANGFVKVAAIRRDPEFSYEDTLAVRRETRPVWSRLEGADIVCASNGHLLQLPDEPFVIELLTRLREFDGASVSDVVDALVGDEPSQAGDTVLAALAQLHRTRALDLCPDPAPPGENDPP